MMTDYGALQIKADFQSSTTVVGKDWQCQKCGEISELQFTSCWKCGALRAEQIPVKRIEREQTAPAPDKKEIVEQMEVGTMCCLWQAHRRQNKVLPILRWTQPREFYDPDA